MTSTPEALSDTEILFCLTQARQLASDGTGRRIRVASKASLSEIARACGSTKGTISKWERGLLAPHGAPAIRYGAVITALATTVACEVV
jgi:DNA-binding transcriptional regulator YiaG